MISTHIQRMREKLRAGKTVLGIGITLSDPTVSEAIAPDVDFVWIDLEHNALTVDAMLGHLIAARAGGCASIVRIPTNDVGWVKRVLDSGAEGIILPRAYSAKEVAAFVSACRYPPLGTRGFGPRRPMQYGRLGQTTHPDVVQVMKTIAAKAKTAGKFVGSGLGANPGFAKLLMDCGVQWLQVGNDFEYMIRGCQRTFGEIHGDAQDHSARDSYGQEL